MKIGELFAAARTLLTGPAGPAPAAGAAFPIPTKGADSPEMGPLPSTPQGLFDWYLAQAKPRREWTLNQASKIPATRQILQASEAERLAVLRICVGWLDRRQSHHHVELRYAVLSLLRAILGKQTTLSERDCRELLTKVRSWIASGGYLETECCTWLLPVLERTQRKGGSGWQPELQALRDILDQRAAYESSLKRNLVRLDGLLGRSGLNRLRQQDRWAEVLVTFVSERDPDQRQAWNALIDFAAGSPSAAKPSSRWLDQARMQLQAVGETPFAEGMIAALAAFEVGGDCLLDPVNSCHLRSLLWICSLVDHAPLAHAVAEVARQCFQSGPEGAYEVRLGNAAIFALGSMPCPEAVAQLTRLRGRITYRNAHTEIEKALAAAAKRSGVTQDEIEELTVPTQGMAEVGVLRVTLAGCAVTILFQGAQRVEWLWSGPDGKPRRSVPTAVREGAAEELRALRKQVKEAGEVLGGHVRRLERLLLADRVWKFSEWRERYLDHPLVGVAARRLIWHFREGEQSGLALWRDGELVDHLGAALTGLTPETEVRLWHPLGFAPDVVLDWRLALERWEVTQPFKQAHREVYLLTDAELETATYSNRFAAHILREGVFTGLCRTRGWRFNGIAALYGGEDATASLALPRWELVAEYWLEPVAAEWTVNAQTVPFASDQVRFRRPDGSVVPLIDVPALAFSEVMRDVDLFVGVSSIAADPSWGDRGEQPEIRNYWSRVSFGDLGQSAETRREVLSRLLPRLKIRDRCEIQGKFLVVRGALRIYKIHLGSGNILMSPNDQYLCIVPRRGEGAELQLPFEGDGMLSVILSKALLLANDRAIRDLSIVSQIRLGF